MGAFGRGERTARGPRLGPGAIIALAVAASLFVLAGAKIATAATTTVQAGQQDGGTAIANQFNAASITIGAGDTAHWAWFSNSFGHTVVSFDETGGVPDWQSPVLNGSGQSFDHTFATPGVYTYYCSIHALRSDADPANIDANIALGKMVGKVTVTSSSVGGVAALPDVSVLAAGRGSGSGGWRSTTSIAAIAAAGALSLAVGYAAIRRMRGRQADVAEEDHN